jgi:hypothetical protein
LTSNTSKSHTPHRRRIEARLRYLKVIDQPVSPVQPPSSVQPHDSAHISHLTYLTRLTSFNISCHFSQRLQNLRSSQLSSFYNQIISHPSIQTSTSVRVSWQHSIGSLPTHHQPPSLNLSSSSAQVQTMLYSIQSTPIVLFRSPPHQASTGLRLRNGSS